jgi:hypothetical protein
MNNATSALHINNNINKEVLSVHLYNYLGQKIQTWNKNLNNETIILPIKVSTGVYIVRIDTAKGGLNQKIFIE